ncbi:branched-chain amino acid ABC transporter permease [soil metagenome]|jgi:branched-chain amino acid transport system permease protein
MQVVLNIICAATLYLLISISFFLIYYPIRFFHIAHAVIITFGGYFVFLINRLVVDLPISVFLAVAVATLIGMSCELLIYRQMRKRGMPALTYLIASIGLYTVFQNSISIYFGDDAKIINTANVIVGHELFGAYITSIQIVTILVSTILFISVNLFLRFSVIGKSIRAVANNSELADIYGINSNKIILIAFGIGSALAAIAGILSAMDTNMTPTFGFNLLLYGVVAMIIGGVGSTKGLVFGSLLIATAQNLAAYYIDTKWMDAITYIILILFLIGKPLGFSGQRLKKVEV